MSFSKSVAWGFSCVTLADITGSSMAKMHKQRLQSSAVKALLCEHFSLL